MRLGILGGSFDPVHYGHLLLAETCREACQLDEVVLIPAAVPPHKRERERAPGAQRIEMLKLAIGGHPALSVSSMEIVRGGLSYTVETLRELCETQPHSKLFLLLGADALSDLPTWREPEEICRLATLVVVGRPGAPPPDFGALSKVASPERVEIFRRNLVEMPLIGLSSSDIRRRVAEGKSIRYRTPRAVEKYIESARLYP